MSRRAQWPWIVAVVVVLVGAVVAGIALWQTTVPGDLRLPKLSAGREFPASDLARAEDFETLLRWSFLGSQLVLVVVAVLYARYGARFARESAAGPIGTGFLLGMLGFALLWLAQLPFSILDFWWYRHHDVIDDPWGEFLVGDWLGLGGQFVAVCVVLLVTMGLARRTPRAWPVPAAVALAAVFVLIAFVQPWLSNLDRPSSRLTADAATIARQEGVRDVPLRVQDVGDEEAANAYAFGLGPSRRVVLWSSILDFPSREVRAVVAHEYAHHARRHLNKGLGWAALLLLPTMLIVAVATRRRGGLGTPEAVPVALLVVVVVGLLTSPLQSAASRRYEAEADWSALQTTRDPAAMAGLFRSLSASSLSDPDPPGWYHALFDSHPTLLQRIEMTQAWAAGNGR